MQKLPADIHRLISDILLKPAGKYTMKDIISYCRVSREVNDAVCSNRDYWIRRASVLSDDRKFLEQKSLPNLKKALFLYEKRLPDPIYFAGEGYEKAAKDIFKKHYDESKAVDIAEAAGSHGHIALALRIVDSVTLPERPITAEGALRGIVAGGYADTRFMTKEELLDLLEQTEDRDRAYLSGLAKKGDLNRVKTYLSEIMDEERAKRLAGMIFPYAIKNGSVELIKYLSENMSIAVTEIIEAMRTTLLTGQKSLYQALMRSIPVEIRDTFLPTLTMTAAEAGDLDEVERGISGWPYGYIAALGVAAGFGREELVDKLLEQVPIDGTRSLILTEALRKALLSEHDNIVTKLLSLLSRDDISNAINKIIYQHISNDIEILFPYDNPAMRYSYLRTAIMSNNEEVVRILAPLIDDEEQLMEARKLAAKLGHNNLLPLIV